MQATEVRTLRGPQQYRGELHASRLRPDTGTQSPKNGKPTEGYLEHIAIYDQGVPVSARS
jgi:hypothetical protein